MIKKEQSVIRVRTVRVAPPAVASDGTSFDYDTNVAVYEREMGLKELPPNVKRDAPTLAELINRAFRLRGRLHEGTRVLALPELATIILGPAWQGVDTRPRSTSASATPRHAKGTGCTASCPPNCRLIAHGSSHTTGARIDHRARHPGSQTGSQRRPMDSDARHRHAPIVPCQWHIGRCQALCRDGSGVLCRQRQQLDSRTLRSLLRLPAGQGRNRLPRRSSAIVRVATGPFRWTGLARHTGHPRGGRISRVMSRGRAIRSLSRVWKRSPSARILDAL